MKHSQSVAILRALVIGIVLLCDQITKWFVKAYIHVPCALTTWCSITAPVINQGASWGIGREWAYTPCILACFAVGVAILLYKQAHQCSWYENIGYALIIGGAISNAIDRIWWHGVIDFIDVHYLRYHWPTFNCADIAIVVGALCMYLSGRQNAID